jgi:hypothetical protein
VWNLAPGGPCSATVTRYADAMTITVGVSRSKYKPLWVMRSRARSRQTRDPARAGLINENLCQLNRQRTLGCVILTETKVPVDVCSEGECLCHEGPSATGRCWATMGADLDLPRVAHVS